jgi:hypothetical protein
MKFVNISLASLLAAQPAVAMTVKGFRKQNDPARKLKKTKKAKKAKNPTTNPTVAPTVAPTASPTSPVPEALVCYSSETTTITAAADATDDVYLDIQSSNGILDFGVISVPAAGGDVMLDINASTGGVIDRGNDLDDDDLDDDDLADDDDDLDDDGINMKYAFDSSYIVALGVLLRPGCTTNIGCTSPSIAPVPNALMTLNSVTDSQSFSQVDVDVGEDGLLDYQSRTQMVSGRFFVPDLAPGDYLIQIDVLIGAATMMGNFADNKGWFSETTVVLGPHIVVAKVLQATNRMCDPSMYLSSI